MGADPLSPCQWIWEKKTKEEAEVEAEEEAEEESRRVRFNLSCVRSCESVPLSSSSSSSRK